MYGTMLIPDCANSTTQSISIVMFYVFVHEVLVSLPYLEYIFFFVIFMILMTARRHSKFLDYNILSQVF